MKNGILISTLLTSIALGSTAMGSYSASGVNAYGDKGLGYQLTNGNYYSNTNTSTAITSDASASASLIVYLNERSKNVFTFNPHSHSSTTRSSVGAAPYFSEWVYNTATILGQTQPDPAWVSCGTLCAEGSRSSTYDKTLLTAELSVLVGIVKLSFETELKGVIGGRAFSRGHNFVSDTAYTINQYNTASLVPSARLYSVSHERAGFKEVLGAGLIQDFTLVDVSMPNEAWTSAHVRRGGTVGDRAGRSYESVKASWGDGKLGVELCAFSQCTQKWLYSWPTRGSVNNFLWNSQLEQSRFTW